MRIPFVDLKAQYARIKEPVNQAIQDVLQTTQFVGGERLAVFEQNFARFVGATHGVGASSGTSAIHLALLALGIGDGDEVITPCNTFIATTEAISHAGATQVFVDVLDDSLLIDPGLIEAAITPRTKAIMPVHLFGQSADMKAIRDIAARHSLRVIADAAQAHGAELGGSRKAIQGDLACFSFYPGKNLGAYGDAGIVVTDDAELAESMQAFANHGQRRKNIHDVEGYNYRLDTLQAAILDVKLVHLDKWTEQRRSRAKRYDEAFASGPVRPVHEAAGRRHVYHLYVVRGERRDELQKALAAEGVATGIHYPIPLHLQPAYERLGLKRGTFPVAERAADEILSLPMYPELTDEMVDDVARAVKKFFS
jgi:dTDP-4-amino-4,6-dideoxygalactose transaminase